MQEDIWEYALKRISVKAFDDLLTCGVRSLNGLLRLTPEDMRTYGFSEHIQHEIQNIQNQLHSYQEHSAAKKEYQPEEVVDKHNEYSEKSIETKCVSDDVETHPTIRLDELLFERLVERLPTRAKRALRWAEIWTVEQLMELTEEVLFKIPSIGRKTVHDIKHLQVKIKIQSENAQSPIEQDRIENPESELKPYPFRIRFLPKSSEHWLSDPAKWSLLSNSLPELFGITFPHFDAYSNNISITISDLDISGPDMFRLRGVSLLPDDTVDLLFSMSLGYLVKTGISSDAFTKIVNCFEHCYEHNELFDFRVISRKLANLSIFNNICLDSISEFRINSLLCVDLFNLLDNKDFIIWEELQNITESEIIEKLGLNLTSLNVINCAWGLKEVAHKLIDGTSDNLPIQAYASFQNLTEAFVRTLLRKPYHYSVLMGRLGFLDGRHWTLEELGQSMNVTRERVRQIEKEYLPKLKKPKTQGRLSLLWHSVDDILNSCGGVCCISEVTAFWVKKWSWPLQPSDEAIASLIGLSSKYEVIWASPARIILPDHACIKCKEIGTFFTKITENQPTGTLCFSVAKNAMLSFCKEKSCAFVRDIAAFSNGYIHFLDEAIEEILADEDTLYTQSAWVKKYGKSLTGLVESIMRDAGRAMHFTEVSAEINKDRPEHEKIADRNVHAGLTRSSEVILWDRGTFIHSDHVSIPKDVICKIEKEIIRRVDCGIPFLVVNGIYKLFIDELTAKNVPSESALYSCLRGSNNKDLICSEYPYILKKGAVQRIPVPLVLEAFVLNQDGVVSTEEIRKYAVETLCVNEDVFNANYLPNTPNLLRFGWGEYLHIDQLDIKEERLTPLVDHLLNLLKISSHVSAIKLYNDKKISCKLMGIPNPSVLYSLIQHFYSDQFDFSRFPKITLSGQNDNGMKGIGVAAEVVQYLKEKKAPCSYTELYQHFVDELGYKQMSIYNIRGNNQIKRYSENVIVHIETIHWTDQKQDILESLANSYMKDRASAGKLFGIISDLYEYQYDQLPSMPDYISWTSTLIGDLLSGGGKYRILGTSRNAFVSVPNDKSVESLDDLIFQILNKEYDGAANLDLFVSDMRKAGILRKVLTPEMLKEGGPVVIDGNVVKLARLR